MRRQQWSTTRSDPDGSFTRLKGVDSWHYENQLSFWASSTLFYHLLFCISHRSNYASAWYFLNLSLLETDDALFCPSTYPLLFTINDTLNDIVYFKLVFIYSSLRAQLLFTCLFLEFLVRCASEFSRFVWVLQLLDIVRSPKSLKLVVWLVWVGEMYKLIVFLNNLWSVQYSAHITRISWYLGYYVDVWWTQVCANASIVGASMLSCVYLKF